MSFLYILLDGFDSPKSLLAAFEKMSEFPRPLHFQFRQKSWDENTRQQTTWKLLGLMAPPHQLFYNGPPRVAFDLGTDGVHLRDDGSSPAAAKKQWPNMLVGKSTHSAASAIDSSQQGADITVLGPVWETPSKKGMGKPIGIEAITAASAAGAKIFAIGGVNEPRVGVIRKAGAAGIAVNRAIALANAPLEAIHRFEDAWANASDLQ